MDTINSGINNSNKMKTYAEGNNSYISPNIGNNRGNDKNITVKADTETMDFSDVNVDSILAEEDSFAVETNHISSKPIYATTLGTEIKFSKGYSNVYDAANNSNSLNLNSSIIFDGTSRINKFKALDSNGNLVDLHIDVTENMNIDDIMYLVSKEAKNLEIDYDKIVVNVVDENNNSRAWVKASDILLESQLIKEVNESTPNIVKNNTSNQVDTSLPHNISDANDIETFSNNNDTNTASSNIASSSNNAFESIKKTASTVVGKIGGFLSGVAAAQTESAKASAKVREEISKSTTSTIQTAVKTGLENLSKVGTNINKIDKENLSFYENFGNFVDTLSSDAIAMSSDFKSFMTESNELLSNAQDWLVNDALPVIENVSSIVSNTLERTGATVGTVISSLVEGVGNLAGAILDTGITIIGSAVSLATYVFIDAPLNLLYSIAYKKEWDSISGKIMAGTKAFVAKKHVSGWFDSFYENNSLGKWLKSNSLFFNNVREITNGVGYTAGIIGLTLLTGGVGGIAGGTAGVAGIAGVGKGAEDAWGKGASTLGGLASGTLNGLWEGFQFFIGAKINGINIFGKSAPTINTKLANSLIHVVLDGIDGGAEGFARTLIDTCYKDGYTDDNGNYVKYTNADSILKKLQENFDDLGGFNTVLTGAISGMATSAISEAFDLGKYFKDTSDNNKVLNLLEKVQNDNISRKKFAEAVSKMDSKKLQILFTNCTDQSLINEAVMASKQANLAEFYKNIIDNKEVLNNITTSLDSVNLNKVLSSFDTDTFNKMIGLLDIDYLKSIAGQLDTDNLSKLLKHDFNNDEILNSLINTIEPIKLRMLFNDGLLNGIKDNVEINFRNATTCLIPISTLLGMIDDDDAFKTVSALNEYSFVNNPELLDFSRKEYILAFKELKEAIEKNGYQNAFTDMELSRIRQLGSIADDFIKFSNLETKIKVKDAFGDVIHLSNGKVVDTEQFLLYVAENSNDAITKNTPLLYQIDNAEVCEIVTNICNKVKYLESHGYMLDMPYMQSLYDIRNNADKFNFLKKVDMFAEYANGEMLEKFKKEFLGYGGVDKSRIAAVKNTCEFLSAEDFKARCENKNWMAYNNGVNSVINITSYSQELTKLNIAHESCHQLSHHAIFDSDGNFLAYKKGLSSQPGGSKSIRVGLNEATTELLAECIEGSEHANECGYMRGVSGLRDLLDLNIPGFNLENLKNAYFSHDFKALNFLASSIDKVGGEGCFDRLVTAMDEASLKYNDTNLREIIDELALKLQISRK